jgi:hypothetical protein
MLFLIRNVNEYKIQQILFESKQKSIIYILLCKFLIKRIINFKEILILYVRFYQNKYLFLLS